jgi:DNA-binding HxlR family transcriptional regulator
VAVQAHLRHARLGDDPIDPNHPHALLVEEPAGRAKNALARDVGHDPMVQTCLYTGARMLVPISSPPETARLAGRVLELVSGRWRSEILVLLADEPRRFNELLRALDGVSGTVLARVLRALEQDGLLTRDDGYAITPLGESLVELLVDIAAWGSVNLDAVVDAPRSW